MIKGISARGTLSRFAAKRGSYTLSARAQLIALLTPHYAQIRL